MNDILHWVALQNRNELSVILELAERYRSLIRDHANEFHPKTVILKKTFGFHVSKTEQAFLRIKRHIRSPVAVLIKRGAIFLETDASIVRPLGTLIQKHN